MRNDDLRGVYGWLRWLVIVLLVPSPLFLIGGTSNDIYTVEKLSPQMLTLPGWDTYKTVIWSVTLTNAAALFASGWRLLKHHIPSSVGITIAVLWATPFASVFAAKVAATFIFDINIPVKFDALTQPILFSMIWTAYLLTSKRVKNTYYSSL